MCTIYRRNTAFGMCNYIMYLLKKNIPLKIILSLFLSYYPRVFNLKEDIFS